MTGAPENGFVEERKEVDMQLQGSVKMSDNGLVEESIWIRDFCRCKVTVLQLQTSVCT